MYMNRIKFLGLCLIGVFAMSAATAASAGALSGVPIQGTCGKAAKAGKTYTGKYNDKACSEENAKGEGKYERGSWKQLKKKAFTGKGGATTLDAYIKGFGLVGSVSCRSTKDKGEITGPSTMSLTLELQKCESGGQACASSGAKTGTIVEGPLRGELGYIEEEPVRIGVAYHTGLPPGNFTCGSLDLPRGRRHNRRRHGQHQQSLQGMDAKARCQC